MRSTEWVVGAGTDAGTGRDSEALASRGAAVASAAATIAVAAGDALCTGSISLAHTCAGALCFAGAW